MGKYFAEEEIFELGQKKKGVKPDYIPGGPDIYSDGFEHVVATGEEHVLIAGPTASGKTRSIGLETIENIICAGESYISVDSKTATYINTAERAKTAGYNIYVLNLAKPLSSSAAYNPLKEIYDQYQSGDIIEQDIAMDRLKDIAYSIITDDGHDEKFWPNSARALFAAVCEALFLKAQPEETHMYSAFRMVTDGEQRNGLSTFLKDFFEKIIGRESNAFQNASGFILAPSETRGGILSTYLDSMSLFSGFGIKEILSRSEFRIGDIKDGDKWAIYMILPDTTTKYHQIGVMFLMELYHHLIDIAEASKDGRLSNRWNFLLEEFGNYKIPDAASMFSASRSRNIRLYAFIQTLEQLEYRYGRELASVISDNCRLQYYFATSNLTTLKELESVCGVRREWDEQGRAVERPVLSIADIQKMPKSYALIRYKGKQWVALMPDWSRHYASKKQKLASLPTYKAKDEIKAFKVLEALKRDRMDNPQKYGMMPTFTATPIFSPFCDSNLSVESVQTLENDEGKSDAAEGKSEDCSQHEAVMVKNGDLLESDNETEAMEKLKGLEEDPDEMDGFLDRFDEVLKELALKELGGLKVGDKIHRPVIYTVAGFKENKKKVIIMNDENARLETCIFPDELYEKGFEKKLIFDDT